MDRSKLGKILLLTLALPFAAYLLINCIAGYIPPTESYKKTPYQFEEAFNMQMAQYGMSIDIDSVDFSRDENDYLKKVVPVICEDGSTIICTYFATSEYKKSLLQYIKFEQEVSDKEGETIHIEQLLAFLMDEFVTVMKENKDETFGPASEISYNEALKICRDFCDSSEQETEFFVYPEENHGRAVTLKRKAGEISSLSIGLYLR